MRHIRAVVLLCFIALIGGLAHADSIVRIHLHRGATIVTGTVVLGETERYGVEARAGQRMSVRLQSIDDNAAFRLYEPSSHRVVSRREALRWEGRLRASGMYIIEVASERGVASFRLHVQIR